MKKLFVVLALLAITGFASAQEIKFDGYVNSGLGIISTDIKDQDTILKAFGVDSEQNGYRFRLNGSYANEAKNAGVKFRFQSQSRLDQAGYFSLPYTYGWANFLNNIFYLAGGIVDDSTWATGDWWIADDVGEGLGMLLKATPVKGLDLGIGAYVISQQSGSSNNILNLDGDPAAFSKIIPRFGDAKYTYSAAYTMPEMFRVGASFRWKNKAGWDKTHPGSPSDKSYEYKYEGRHETSQLIGELRFLGVKDLTAVVAGNFDVIENFDENGNMVLSESFGYKLNDLNIGLNAVEFFYVRKTNGDQKDYNPGMLFNLWGSYAINNIVPRLDLAYFWGGQSTVASGDITWHRKGFKNLAKEKDAKDDYSVFSVRPSVKFNLDSKTFIEIGDVINIDFAGKDGAYKDDGDAKKKSMLSNAFYIDLKFSF